MAVNVHGGLFVVVGFCFNLGCVGSSCGVGGRRF